MNEQNEIRGDEWADVLESAPCYLCEADDHTADECLFENAPEIELDESDLESWYTDWLKRNPE